MATSAPHPAVRCSQAWAACAEPGAPEQQDVSWSQLPDAVLEVIGGSFRDPRELEGASLVCKGWRNGFASGMPGIELTVHRDAEQWRNRVARLRQLLPGLRRCKAHVGAGVSAALPGAISALAQELQSMEHLELHLGEGCQITLETGLEFSNLRCLRSLTLRGGTFAPADMALLLRGLAVACPALEELRVLPEALCGLGDDEMPLLAAMKGLRVIEFQAYRLTGAGLLKLTSLPQLEWRVGAHCCMRYDARAHGIHPRAAGPWAGQSLSVQGMDCLSGLDAPCFKLCPSLKHLSLGCDYVPPPDVVARLREIEGLTMAFRSTDKVAGLLRTLSMHLTSSLVKLDMGVVRIMREEALEGITQLNRLTDLRLAVTGNSDEPVTLRLDQLAPLSNLQVLHVCKGTAYFPDRRRMGEASVRIPVDAASTEALAAACGQLRSLRLSLGAGDVLPEGLARLSMFSQLDCLSVHAESFSAPAPAVPLSLAHLPARLTSLELRHVELCGDPQVCQQVPPGSRQGPVFAA
ncbi:hypothetical protein MNEG_12543 [Monoraphidium neglectum]|uniref:F-box domain-containing protein n=1 Tax=Monoraphidium neglectum TaxID=145388 RepID=A0A0D2KHX1_9CHLO|nr:hypothetical protein MNEG_12543 [Monoraphidium neglectum]KIY95418.1 hypothetical protein MNEG_12543 [Monoraphidium neglectum]|eukprot:XP_013894438.1 hypothetical protein MNEG_12543 [Monoraphidium neglectum]